MPKVWSITNQRGFSVVEALLAATVFGMIATAVIGAFVYGRGATANAGNRERANMLAEEGVEAVRNLRDGAGYSTLADGTYGLAKSGGVWTLSGSSDANDIYTRQITIASNGTNRKTVTSTVSWNQGFGTVSTSVASQFANWRASLAKSWRTPTALSSNDLTGTIAGYKIATSGNYAYLVRNSATGPNFFIINITTPSAPTVAGSLTLAGIPTNVAVSGNYAYVSNSSDTAELQIVNVTTPATPTLAGTYNASGTGDGRGVYAVGTTAYLSRAANGGNDEFVIVNCATPSLPTRVGGYGLNVNMNEVYVFGTAAYVATSSDTQELLVINMLVPGLLALGTAVNLPGTTDATTVDGNGSTLIIGQGTAFYAVNMLVALIPVLGGTVTLSGTINDVSYDPTHNYAHVGTGYASGEFQVVDVANTAAPSILSSVDVTGTAAVTGVAYNTSKDVTPGAISLTNMEVIVFAPN